MSDLYLHDKASWLRLHDYLMTNVNQVGFDTEFDNPDATCRPVVVWSIAAFPKEAEVHPRGHREAVGYLLPSEALPVFRPLLETRAITKYVHNAPADTRSVYDTHKIVLRQAVCTLEWTRVAYPGLSSYGLKPLSRLLLGKPARPGFKDVTSYLAEVPKVKQTKTKLCTCGQKGCKKRLGGHVRVETVVSTTTVKVVPKTYLPSEITPGHSRWDEWEAYAIEDAVDALELADHLRQHRGWLHNRDYMREASSAAKEWRAHT